MDSKADDSFEVDEPQWLVATLLAAVEALRDNLNGSTNAPYSAYLVFDADLVGLALRAINLLNQDIDDEARRVNPYWMETSGQIDKAYAKTLTILHNQKRDAIVGGYRYDAGDLI